MTADGCDYSKVEYSRPFRHLSNSFYFSRVTMYVSCIFSFSHSSYPKVAHLQRVTSILTLSVNATSW